MSKKILGLIISVALLMVVLSGCFLLPQPDIYPPTVTIVSPTANQTFTVPTTSGATNVTITATVSAHSPLQSVVVTLSQNNQPYATVNASGPFGQTSGQFTYTFTSLPVGSYYVQVSAQSAAKNPGSASQKFTVASAQAVTPPSTKYAKPVVGLVNVAPNYMGKYYVANSPITFSATVTNPSGVGQLAVWASVNGQTIQPNNSSTYTFTWTPSATGTYTLYVNAIVTIGASTVSGSNSVVVKVPYIKPVATVSGTPSRLVMASTTPASFTFTTTSGVNAYLSISNGTATTYTSTYTSQYPIANSKLTPNVWNTLTLTFKDPWGNLLPQYTKVATVLGIQPQNGANTTPYLFLIDKTGHVVSNTNDWITVPAGNYLDLYGYVQAGQGQTINSYNIKEQYFSNQETTAPLTNETSIASASSINSQIVPLKINAYLFNTSTTSPAFVPFNAYINGQQVKAFIRYQVEPETAGPSVSISVANTWEGVPAAITVTASNNNLQPLTGLVFSAPVNVTPASSWYGYTKPAMTAYGLTTSTTMASRVTYSANPLNNLIAPVSAVQASGANAYGFVTGSKTYYVAFYGPSGTYSLKATVTNIANAIANPSTTYLVQADTSAPIANITLSGSYVTVNGEKVYYAPQLKATFNINDDHAIYWAKLSFATNLQVYYPNNNQIFNYGVTATTVTVPVLFNNGVGNYTFWPIATDKHFDAKTYNSALATTTVIGTGNIVNQATTTVYYDNGSQLSASLLGGQYNAGINSEYYEFVVKASDGNGIGLSNTGLVYVKTLSGSLVATVPATLTASATPNYYYAIFDTYSVPNGFYNVSLGVTDKMYSYLPAQYQSSHIRIVNWGTIQVNNAYPNVTISNVSSNGLTTIKSTPVQTLKSDVFRITVRDPQLQAWWNGINSSNYQQYFNITLTSSYSNTVITNPMSFFRGISSATGNATTGYILIEIPQIYFNGPTTAPATVQIQVAVYNHPQDDKAIFGQSLGNFVPAPLFTNNQSTFGVNVGGSTLTYAASSATFVVVNANGVSPTFPVTVNGLNLSTVSTTTNMSLYFYANGNLIDTVPAANFVSGSSQQVYVPTSAGLSTVALSVIYAPSPVRNSAAKAKVLSSPVGYQYTYPLGTLHVLGDLTPVATLSLSGKSINGLSKILTTNNSSATFVVGAPAFYYHDILTKYATFLGMNTTLTGNVLVKTFANQSGKTYNLNLGALTKLASATLAQGNQYVVTTTAGSTPLAFSKAGVYTLTFTPNDPFVSGANNQSATVVVGLVPPALTSIPTTLNFNSTLNATVVSPILSTITFGATDDAGIAAATINVLNPFNGKTNNLTLTPTTSLGTGIFTDSFSANVTLPSTYNGYKNNPFVVTYTVKDVAGYATTTTRLFVTDSDTTPFFTVQVNNNNNTVVVNLSEPMWVNGFKNFSAYSGNLLTTINSQNITAVNPVWIPVENAYAASQFVVTFPQSTVLTNLSNFELSSSSSNYYPIVDLAGNKFSFVQPNSISLNVTVSSTNVLSGQTATITAKAYSPSGISSINASAFNQPTQTQYTPVATFTFTAPSVPIPTTSVKAKLGLPGEYGESYTATVTAYSNSGVSITKTVMLTVYPKSSAPVISISAPATVGSGKPFTATITMNNPNSGVKTSTFVATFNGVTVPAANITQVPQTGSAYNPYTMELDLSLTAPSTTASKTTQLTASVQDYFGAVGTGASTIHVYGATPTVTISAPATVAAGVTFTATVTAKAQYTGNSIASVMINGKAAIENTTTTTEWATTLTFTGNSPQQITAVVTDHFGNVTTKSTTVSVDGITPTITVKIGTTVAMGTTLTSGINSPLYFKSSPKATITVTEGNYSFTAKANYSYYVSSTKSTPLVFTPNTTTTPKSSTTSFSATYSGKYYVTVSATDIHGLATTFSATVPIAFGSTPPTAVATLTYNSNAIGVGATHYYINSLTGTYPVSYKFASNNTGMPLKSAELLLYNGSSTQTVYSYSNISGLSNTFNLNLPQYVGSTNGATFVITTIATDMVGNTTTHSTKVYVDNVPPTVTGLYVSKTQSGSPLVITFSSTMYKTTTTTTFTATLTDTTTGSNYYGLKYVGDFAFTPGATAAEATSFKVVGGTTVSSTNLALETYTLTLPSTVTDLALNPVSNNNGSFTITTK